tara:strand:+ start:2106 stop:2900 length:795 start_codon:yes stop_codon:yes gene_type:complete
MKILTITGNHLRHKFFINSISEKHDVTASIIVGRESIMPSPPEKISDKDRENFIRHFKNRDDCEKKYFSLDEEYRCPNVIQINAEELNSKATSVFVKTISPDIVIIFGSGMIKSPLIEVMPKETINMHGGLSPRYRGSATMFWPFYFLEPAYAGLTFHYINTEPDAGDIIHQSVPSLSIGDRIHDVACKAVQQGALDFTKLLDFFLKKERFSSFKQKGTGKNFLSSDFRVEHLRMIYNTFNDDIVDHFINNKIAKKVPKLIRQY